jgi:hypothetical protein
MTHDEMVRSRLPQLTGFIGPGHKRHALYRTPDAQEVPACNAPTEGKLVNHVEAYLEERVNCARCKRMLERIRNGVTPDHLRGAL